MGAAALQIASAVGYPALVTLAAGLAFLAGLLVVWRFHPVPGAAGLPQATASNRR